MSVRCICPPPPPPWLLLFWGGGSVVADSLFIDAHSVCWDSLFGPCFLMQHLVSFLAWLSFVVSSVSLSLSHWYPGSGVVLDCIDSWSLQPYLLCNNLDGEDKVGCFSFNCIPCVLLVLVFCGFSSLCRRLLCSVLLWYSLIILFYVFFTFDSNAILATRNICCQLHMKMFTYIWPWPLTERSYQWSKTFYCNLYIIGSHCTNHEHQLSKKLMKEEFMLL